MPRRRTALLVLLLGILCATAAAILLGDWRSDRYRLRSEALRETRRYLVSLPAGLRFSREVLPGEGHSPERSLERALRFIFAQLSQRVAARRR